MYATDIRGKSIK